MTAANVGKYDIKLIAQYTLNDFKTRYENVVLSSVFLQFHLYQSSLCKFVPGKGPTKYTY